jgi:hypothetical protein
LKAFAFTFQDHCRSSESKLSTFRLSILFSH